VFVELMFLVIIIGLVAVFVIMVWKGCGITLTYHGKPLPEPLKRCYVCGGSTDYIILGTPICRKCLEKVFKFIVDEYKKKRGG